jgi:hypothetical protein
MTERSTSDLVFRPDSPDRDGPGCGPDAATLREELAKLQHASRPVPRVVPAARDRAGADEPTR